MTANLRLAKWWSSRTKEKIFLPSRHMHNKNGLRLGVGAFWYETKSIHTPENCHWCFLPLLFCHSHRKPYALTKVAQADFWNKHLLMLPQPVNFTGLTAKLLLLDQSWGFRSSGCGSFWFAKFCMTVCRPNCTCINKADPTKCQSQLCDCFIAMALQISPR